MENHDTAFVMSHFGLGDSITIIGAVRYLCSIYKKVNLICREKYITNVKLFYTDLNNINIIPIRRPNFIHPNYGASLDTFKKYTKNMDLYLGGNMVLNKIREPYNNLPLNFYKDMNLNTELFWSHYKIPTNHFGEKLYNELKDNSYIFIHKEILNKQLFNIKNVCTKFNINPDEIIIIDSSENYYNKEHKFYDIAQQFIFKPLVYYIQTIINAKMVIVTDSCFFCLAINLEIKTKECYYVTRKRNFNYNHLFNNEYKPKEYNKPIFKKIFL